jgi:hypothetical protein
LLTEQRDGDEMSGYLLRVPVAVAALGMLTAPGGTQTSQTGRREPRDAIATIVDAFRTHPVVALEEQHGDERGHAFRLALIRDPRFASAVHDIVVEFGNSRYQHLMDRFVDAGDVSDAELRQVWQNTTQAHAIWDRPIYEQFFRAVRAVNATLPRERRLRVVLGDPPIDWDAVRTPDDLRKWHQVGRSRHAADVVLREVLAKQRRALVLYGAFHLLRGNPVQGANLIDHVEHDGRIKSFVVITHPVVTLEVLGLDPAPWRTPSIVLTSGSTLERQVDAILYLGPPSDRRTSRLSRALCADVNYRHMRIARMTLSGDADASATLAKECSAAQ